MAKKGKKKSKRRAPRRKKNRRKPIQRGMLGKVGAFIAGVFPVIIAGTDSAAAAYGAYKKKTVSGISAVQFFLYRFINDMSNGYLGILAMGDEQKYIDPDGNVERIKNRSGIPKYSLLYNTGVGLLMMGIDAAASKLAGGRPVKIMGTNYNATGGS